MKTINRFVLRAGLLWLLFCAGCQSNRKLADGFYLYDETGKSPRAIAVKDADGKDHQLAVCEFTNLVVNDVLAFSLKPYEEAFQVQIHVASTDTNWSQKIPVLIIQGKPYMELTRTPPPAESDSGIFPPSSTVGLKVSSESEANLIRRSLNEKFCIKPR